MNTKISHSILIFFCFFGLNACAQTYPQLSTDQNVKYADLEYPLQASTLDGKVFDGKIRAKGIYGLFSVAGRLSFKNGNLVWTVNSTSEQGPVAIKSVDNVLIFTARLPSDNDTFVDWSGVFDGKKLISAQAVWNRESEDDFIHDILLPDKLTLEFTTPIDDSSVKKNRSK